MRRDVFQAIADPTRREILQLVTSEPMPLNAVADRFPVSRPAISRHMKILVECGLVSVEQRGRERYCRARPARLEEVASWLEPYRTFWTQKLDALQVFLEQEQMPRPSGPDTSVSGE